MNITTMGDTTEFIRGKMERRNKVADATFIQDGFQRWAESDAPGSAGGVQKEGGAKQQRRRVGVGAMSASLSAEVKARQMGLASPSSGSSACGSSCGCGGGKVSDKNMVFKKVQEVTGSKEDGLLGVLKKAEALPTVASVEGSGFLSSLGKLAKKGVSAVKKVATKENLAKLKKAAKTGVQLYAAAEEAGLTKGNLKAKVSKVKELAKKAAAKKLAEAKKAALEADEDEDGVPDVEEEEVAVEGGKKAKRAPSARNQAVAKVMKERGVKLGEASRIVKEEGLAGAGFLSSLGKLAKKGVAAVKKVATKENLAKLKKGVKTGVQLYAAAEEAGLTKGNLKAKVSKAKELAKKAAAKKLAEAKKAALEADEDEDGVPDVEEEEEDVAVEGGKKAKRAPSARNKAVAKVMKERGVKLGEASRIVKAEGLA